MKRLMALVLVLAMCVFALGYAEVVNIHPVTPTPVPTKTSTPAPTDTPAPTASTAPIVTEAATEVPTTAVTEAVTDVPAAVTPAAVTDTPAPTATVPVQIKPPATLTDLGTVTWVLEADGEESRANCIVNLLENPNAEWSFLPGRPVLEIVFPQIVSADAAILRLNDHVMMIDAGGETEVEAVAEALRLMGVTEVELGYNSHPHHDHIPGFALLAGTVKLDKVLYGFGENANQHIRKALADLATLGIPTEKVKDGAVLSFAGVGERLYVTRRVADNLSVNDLSLVLKVNYGKRSILFTGDNEKESMRLLSAREPESGLSADILKYPHHGFLRLYQKFAELVHPAAAIITNTKAAARYGCDSLQQYGIQGFFTDQMILRLRTDGEIWVIDELVPGTK